ncbi:hypothetical protein NP233_g10854 [Leucocoprinus birnbaumii]|uniref:DUF4110 domain-containing protein n=1 Tax=Leucocoprinus birnbaumii TaxID=56174 RepID=A0AAD5YRH9_9AGAR|nr:hypothetical protein NP233_g10854 [Leucocoprinus birnbaumii]
MGKKKTSSAAAKAAKKAKTAQKTERKEKKKVTKSKSRYDSEDEDDQDLEAILEKMRKEWEEAHTVTEELVEGPPSRRANATLTACPNGNHLWCIGGEFFSEDGKAYFYNDVFRYTPDKDEWRKFVSPTCPGPRSAHAVASSPAGGGKLFLFGGEFSSLHQTTFHHYRDFWCFDIGTHSWDRIDTKIRPSARSGHRMTTWKHYIILFGGFYDPGVTTRYLNDLWVFDTQEYKWSQVEFRETDPKPSARSGFSFLPCPDGVILHGGYCKEYAKGKRPVGVMLEDTWLLKITMPTIEQEATSGSNKPNKNKPAQSQLTFKWERRKRASDAYAPSLRSGCTMALWNRGSGSGPTGILFGGVTDEDNHEETLESVFHNDMFGYQTGGRGKWVSMALKKPKARGGKKATRADKRKEAAREANRRGRDSDEDDDGEEDEGIESPTMEKAPSSIPPTENDPDDPSLTLPIPRYNAMLAVLRNTLYIYGGIFEKGSKEYTLDDFYSLQLDKLDRFTCMKASTILIPDGEEESSSDEDDDDDDEDDDNEDDGRDGVEADSEINDEPPSVSEGLEERKKSKRKKALVQEEEEVPDVRAQETVEAIEEDEPDSLRSRANIFMGVSKDTTRSAEDILSTPLPGETLAMFYARSREYWSQKAYGTSDNRGKELRRDGFGLAEERYAEYKPILEEVEKILAEAGLDEEEMRRGAALGGGPSASGQSRNRRRVTEQIEVLFEAIPKMELSITLGAFPEHSNLIKAHSAQRSPLPLDPCLLLFFQPPTARKRDSQDSNSNSKLKLKLSSIFKSPFSRRGKKKVVREGEDGPQTSSSCEDMSRTGAPADGSAPTSNREDDATSTTRGSRSSFDAPTPTQLGTNVTAVVQELSSTEGRCQSPAPSQARSMRQSITKTTSGENVRVSITVDTIKQQLNDGLQILAEFKKSLRPSSDVQRYDEAVGSLEGAAKGLTTLKNKLSNRKVGGSTNSRNSYVLPPPDLKVDFEDTPFSMTIPGIEESGKETTLGVVPENGEVQEEVKGRIEL